MRDECGPYTLRTLLLLPPYPCARVCMFAAVVATVVVVVGGGGGGSACIFSVAVDHIGGFSSYITWRMMLHLSHSEEELLPTEMQVCPHL